MKRYGKSNQKLFYSTVFLLLVVFMCVAQSTVERRDAQAEETTSDSLLSVLVPEENPDTDEVLPVTADADISDLLLPKEEYTDVSDIQTRKYSISGKYNILIYHTHTTEAYRQTEGETYTESSSWRTEDEDRNIVAVGEQLKTELEKYGFNVLHDTTDHEPPKLSTAYSRSIITMEEYKEKYPDIDVYIDVHRDAAGDSTSNDDYVTINGDECAKLMFVVGQGTAASVKGDKPNWQANYALAKSVTEQLESIKEGFTREIRLKPGRYNQHISDMSLLVEVGHNKNTLTQAKNAAKYLAQAFSQVVSVDN